jgi:hypothetical protein
VSTYAQLEDYGNWCGTPVAPDQASEIQFLLNEAEVELAVIAGDLGDRITAGLTTSDRVKTAIVGMVGWVVRERSNEMALLATGTHDVSRVMSDWLKVSRRERWLVGMFTTGNSMDLSTRDPQLVHPLVRAPFDRWSGLCP